MPDCELPSSSVDTPGGRYRLDLAYPDLRIAIEIDGKQHEDLDIALGDERRTAHLEACGWTIIRVRSKHFATDLVRALRELRRTLTESPVDR